MAHASHCELKRVPNPLAQEVSAVQCAVLEPSHVPLPCMLIGDRPPVNAVLADLPHMTQARELRMCGSSRAKYITNMSEQCVVDHEDGQIVYDSDGVFVSARLPASERLQKTELENLDALLVGWARRGRYTRRGESHASICADFIMGGYKGDQDTCMAMFASHVTDSPKVQLAYINLMNRLRTALKPVVQKAEKYFFSMIDSVRDDLSQAGVRYTFLDYFSSTSMGDLFMPRNHTDDDAWVTIMVALGKCSHGGGVAHPACGVVHAVHAGDILVVNPAQGHCTTEFGDALATRKMIAIFLSRNALRACVTSHEVAVANGLQIWEPQQQLRCKRKR